MTTSGKIPCRPWTNRSMSGLPPISRTALLQPIRVDFPPAKMTPLALIGHHPSSRLGTAYPASSPTSPFSNSARSTISPSGSGGTTPSPSSARRRPPPPPLFFRFDRRHRLDLGPLLFRFLLRRHLLRGDLPEPGRLYGLAGDPRLGHLLQGLGRVLHPPRLQFF